MVNFQTASVFIDFKYQLIPFCHAAYGKNEGENSDFLATAAVWKSYLINPPALISVIGGFSVASVVDRILAEKKTSGRG